MIAGIIPAAGRAVRWGGFPKHLLPCGAGETLLQRTANIMRKGGAERIVVVVSLETAPAIMAHLAGESIIYVVQRDNRDLYGAIYSAIDLCGRWTMFAMPDTYLPDDAFHPGKRAGALAVGVFDTDIPERFGVLLDGRVVDKPALQGSYPAWGCLMWDGEVVKYWREQDRKIIDFPDAINGAMREFPTSIYNLEYYYDMATFGDYREFLCLNTGT